MTTAPPSSHVVALSGWTLAEDQTLRRDHVRKPDKRSAHYLERYDDRTLFYDCVYLADQQKYLFTSPRFLNLWRPFRSGLRMDGKPVGGLSRRTWLRCEQAALKATPGELELSIGRKHGAIDARPDQMDRFAGLNCVAAVNKNNALNWVRDWANYYVSEHGADGIVLFDNGSTEYSADALAATLSAIDGLKAHLVYSAPYPYGPTDRSGKFEVSPRFFQSAMLNIARRDALWKARAVLNVDIDEIVRKSGDTSVFDLAVRHPLRMVTIHGTWIYPSPDTVGAVAHAANTYRRVPDRKCNRKWCMTPRGLMARFGWAVHQVGGVLQEATNTSEVHLLHCRGTSTGWKKKRFDAPQELQADPALAAFLAEHFPA